LRAKAQVENEGQMVIWGCRLLVLDAEDPCRFREEASWVFICGVVNKTTIKIHLVCSAPFIFKKL